MTSDPETFPAPAPRHIDIQHSTPSRTTSVVPQVVDIPTFIFYETSYILSLIFQVNSLSSQVIVLEIPLTLKPLLISAMAWK
jgi:hypothetical protein